MPALLFHATTSNAMKLPPLLPCGLGLVFALAACAVIPLASHGAEPPPWKTQIPPPALEEQKLGVLLGQWQSPFRGEKSGLSAAENVDGVWEGRWILDGHVLTLTAAKRATGMEKNKLYVFGYFALAARYWMMVVTAGDGAADRVEVSWFTIEGNVWRFAPIEDRSGDKTVRRQLVWEIHPPNVTTTMAELSSDSVAWTLPPTEPAMAKLAGWVGRWANRHQEHEFDVDGAFDSNQVADGYFLGWFETNVLRYKSGKNVSEREVDIWGYSDVARLYFRLDATTYLGGDVRVNVDDSDCRWFGDRGEGVVLISPLEQQKIDGRAVSTRWGFFLDSPDMMLVFAENLEDGIRWTDAPDKPIKWPRIR